jgi:glycine cleavage system transcriptional repressor
MENQLLICAFGPDKPGIVEELSNIVLKNECSVADSRMAVLGDYFSVLMLAVGDRGKLKKLGEGLQKIRHLSISLQKVKERAARENIFVYAVKMIGADTKGIVHKVTSFFKSRKINVLHMDTEVTNAPYSGTPMFSMTMRLEVPQAIHIRRFKQGLIDLCDELNMDVDIEQVVV